MPPQLATVKVTQFATCGFRAVGEPLGGKRHLWSEQKLPLDHIKGVPFFGGSTILCHSIHGTGISYLPTFSWFLWFYVKVNVPYIEGLGSIGPLEMDHCFFCPNFCWCTQSGTPSHPGKNQSEWRKWYGILWTSWFLLTLGQAKLRKKHAHFQQSSIIFFVCFIKIVVVQGVITWTPCFPRETYEAWGWDRSDGDFKTLTGAILGKFFGGLKMSETLVTAHLFLCIFWFSFKCKANNAWDITQPCFTRTGESNYYPKAVAKFQPSHRKLSFLAGLIWLGFLARKIGAHPAGHMTCCILLKDTCASLGQTQTTSHHPL